MVNRVECVCKIQVDTVDLLQSLCSSLKCPVQRLNLALRRVQLAEALLRGVEQAVPLRQSLQTIRQDRGQNLVCCVEQTHWAVAGQAQGVAFLEEEANQPAQPRWGRG